MKATAEDIRVFNAAFTEALEEFYFSARYCQETISKTMRESDLPDGTDLTELGTEAFLFHMKKRYEEEAAVFNAIRDVNDIINENKP